MKLKQYKQYQMNFKSKWIQPSAMLMGVSFFLRIFYYFGFRFVSDWSFWDVLFQIALPLAFAGAFTVILWTVKRNAPGLYALIGGSFCILTFIWSLYTGNFLYILLCLVYYPATAIILTATAGGYLPGKLLSSIMLLLPVVVRLLTLKPFVLGIDGVCLELSVIFMLGSLFCFTRSLREIKAG